MYLDEPHFSTTRPGPAHQIDFADHLDTKPSDSIFLFRASVHISIQALLHTFSYRRMLDNIFRFVWGVARRPKYDKLQHRSATIEAGNINKMKKANRLVQLIAGPWGVSMNANLTFDRSGTGPAGRRAGRVPSLPFLAIHAPRQPAIPDEGRSPEIYP